LYILKRSEIDQAATACRTVIKFPADAGVFYFPQALTQEAGLPADWIDLGQDRDRWWALVNAVMSSFFPKK
jgi:hypothetical protein